MTGGLVEGPGDLRSCRVRGLETSAQLRKRGTPCGVCGEPRLVELGLRPTNGDQVPVDSSQRGRTLLKLEIGSVGARSLAFIVDLRKNIDA